MAFRDKDTVDSEDLSMYQTITLVVGIVFSIYFVLTPFLKRDDYNFDSYELLYSDDDLYAPEPDAIEMTAFV